MNSLHEHDAEQSAVMSLHRPVRVGALNRTLSETSEVISCLSSRGAS